MLISKLLDAHRDTLKEEGTIAELLRRVEELTVEGEERPPRSLGSKPVSYTHLTLPTIYSV